MSKIKLSLGLCFVMAFLCFASGLQAQDSPLNGLYNVPTPQHNSMLADDSCSTGERHDDGSFENSLAFNPGPTVAEFVIRMRPTSYPWSYNKLCWAMNNNTGLTTMTMDVIVYDTLGAGGTPGAIVFQQNGINLTGIPSAPAYKWFTQAISPPLLSGGSYWVGVRYNPTAFPNRYYSFDAGAGVAWSSYYRIGGAGAWTVLDNTVLQYKCFAFRTEGSAPAGSNVYTRCKRGLNIAIPDNNPAGINDTFVVNIPGVPVYITDMYVIVDTLLTTYAGDITMTLTKGATTVNVMTRPGPGTLGSSGDNFIGTKFADTSQYSIDSITAAGTGSAIPQFNMPFTGWFRCNKNLTNTATVMDSLGRFRGIDPNGVWTANFSDGAAADFGFVRSYCLIIKYGIVGINQTTTEVPNSYFVKQNYPNPFNPVTNIKFGLPKSGDVKLIVFDVLGREVATLVNEFKAAGQYVVDFDASTLSSGVYFYTIQAGDFTETKKMLLVK